MSNVELVNCNRVQIREAAPHSNTTFYQFEKGVTKIIKSLITLSPVLFSVGKAENIIYPYVLQVQTTISLACLTRSILERNILSLIICAVFLLQSKWKSGRFWNIFNKFKSLWSKEWLCFWCWKKAMRSCLRQEVSLVHSFWSLF